MVRYFVIVHLFLINARAMVGITAAVGANAEMMRLTRIAGGRRTISTWIPRIQFSERILEQGFLLADYHQADW
jgi:hypothetical protein